LFLIEKIKNFKNWLRSFSTRVQVIKIGKNHPYLCNIK
jgi:hypothetical protein